MPENQRPAAPAVAVVIPSFRAAGTIGAVLQAFGPEVDRIYVVDDGCPDGTAKAVAEHSDPRVRLIENCRNLGVGGATKVGYRQALADGAGIVVKVDADGQMDPAHIPHLIRALVTGENDYSKGNRFAPAEAMPAGAPLDALATMPLRRRAANQLLRIALAMATGRRDIADPSNGFTAIRADMLSRLDLDSLADCFFFETDMLFALNAAGARVAEVPLPAHYPAHVSNLSLRRVALRFLRLILHRWWLRLSPMRDDAPAAAGAPC